MKIEVYWDKNNDLVIRDRNTTKPLMGVVFDGPWKNLDTKQKRDVALAILEDLPTGPVEFQHSINKLDRIEKLNELGQTIKSEVPAGMGFALLMFDYGDGGDMFYLSSAERSTMIKAMREFIQKNVM